VVVVARSGFDTVCIDRRTGAYPIKALTVDIGTRRPMGVGAGSLSMLGMLPPQESDSILQAVAERLPAHTRASMAQIRAAVRVARDAGFAVSNGYVTERVRAIAVAIRDLRGDASVSLGIAAIESRIPERRIPQLVNALQRERARVETRIRSGSPPRPDPSERRAGHAVTR
jgi:DNA-binding IclR family transcriptional regulator